MSYGPVVVCGQDKMFKICLEILANSVGSVRASAEGLYTPDSKAVILSTHWPKFVGVKRHGRVQAPETF